MGDDFWEGDASVQLLQRNFPKDCSTTSVFACDMLQGWGLEGWGLGLAESRDADLRPSELEKWALLPGSSK